MAMRVRTVENRRRKRRDENPTKDKEGSLEVCLRSYENKFMCFSIPNFTALLESLTLSSSSPDTEPHHHHHIYDDHLVSIDANRFPVFTDINYLINPFPLVPDALRVFKSTIVGSTLYCLDIGDIFVDIVPPPPPSPPKFGPPLPPPGNSIIHQFTSIIDAYNDSLSTPLPVNSPDQWGITDNFNITTPSQTPPPTLPSTSKTMVKENHYKAWMLDLRNPHLPWSQTKPLISPRLSPHLVSYQAKLYVFGGNHPPLPFAEVYDPLSRKWTQLPQPPFRILARTRMFVVPLKAWGKIWVFSVDGAVDYTFHVRTRKWHKFTSARRIVPLFPDSVELMAALNPNNHMVVYWMTTHYKVYAYNLSTNQLFMGVIPGTHCVEGQLGYPLVIHHLQGDIFCIIGAGFPSDRLIESTVLHVTILQITTKPPPKPRKAPSKARTTPPKPLIVAILACLSYRMKDYFNLFDTYLMSNNI